MRTTGSVVRRLILASIAVIVVAAALFAVSDSTKPTEAAAAERAKLEPVPSNT